MKVYLFEKCSPRLRIKWKAVFTLLSEFTEVFSTSVTTAFTDSNVFTVCTLNRLISVYVDVHFAPFTLAVCTLLVHRLHSFNLHFEF